MQIISVGGCHWCTVSNIGCDDGVVNVYDSMYSSASSGMIKLIASLMFSPAEQLVVRMMDVGRQLNGSDCGVLAIALAYDICSGNDPCKIKYDHRSIRHLADCSKKCCLSRFPEVGERRTVGIRHTQSVDLHSSCRLPEEKGDKMVECDVCKTWYHQHCMNIPDNVFDDESDVPWKYKLCTQNDSSASSFIRVWPHVLILILPLHVSVLMTSLSFSLSLPLSPPSLPAFVSFEFLYASVTLSVVLFLFHTSVLPCVKHMLTNVDYLCIAVGLCG